MSEPEKHELSEKTRIAIAAGLSLAVIIAWSLIYKPPASPVRPPAAQTQSGQEASAPVNAAPAAAPVPAAPVAPATAAAEEKQIVVQSDLYRVVLSNRGAVVRSWELNKYQDEHKPPRTLNVVNPDSNGQWPFSLVFEQPDLEPQVNQALFQVTPDVANQGVLQAPATVTFTWSDGHLQVTKTLTFDASYIVQVSTSALLDGRPIPVSLSWRGGFGDPTVISRRGSLPVQVFSNSAGSIKTLAVGKLGQPKDTTARSFEPGPFEFDGIEDLYFTAAFLPPLGPDGRIASQGLTFTNWATAHETQSSDGKVQKTFLANMAAGQPNAGPLDLRVYVGPKDIGQLKAVQPPLNGVVNFGWFSFLAEPIFYAVRWIDKYVHNYGWAIVIFAVVLNVVFYPLRVKGMRAAQKMQSIAPEIKQIQEKYKKYSIRDPRKAEMNKEIMAVYSREGVNPFGSCWPNLIQLPIWFAVYPVLEYAIELRQAPWIGWIRDLSAPDPYYILPIAVALIMYVTQKMTPTPGVDPAQARMMGLMPLIFGFFFIYYPSGLSLYISAAYVINMGQQWHLNRTSPVKKAPARARKGARPSRVGTL